MDVQGPPAVPFGLPADKDKKPIPGAPANPSPQPFVRGEKQWMDNADNISNWGEKQMETANDRIPYYSTVQISDDEKPSEYEKDVDMSILYEEEPAGYPEKITNLAEKVPIATRLLQLQ